MPNDITKIYKRAFYKCKNISKVIVSNIVTEIGRYAFWVCENLTSIIIPDSVTYIAGYAFDFLTSKTTIYFTRTAALSKWSSLWSEGCNAKIVWGYTEE